MSRNSLAPLETTSLRLNLPSVRQHRLSQALALATSHIILGSQFENLASSFFACQSLQRGEQIHFHNEQLPTSSPKPHHAADRIQSSTAQSRNGVAAATCERGQSESEIPNCSFQLRGGVSLCLFLTKKQADRPVYSFAIERWLQSRDDVLAFWTWWIGSGLIDGGSEGEHQQAHRA